MPTRKGVRRIVLRQYEGRFAEIEFTSNLLHAFGRNADRVRQNRQLITAERCRSENIDDLKCVLHENRLAVRRNMRPQPNALNQQPLHSQLR